MIFFPPAKINIGLNVLGKRDDGYHEITSCMYPIPLYDVLEIVPADSFTFTSSGLPISGDEQSNLCVKAYHILQKSHSVPSVHIHLIKQIPMGAGLGGGSSDGAYVLRALNEMFELNIPTSELENLAAELGSDCPFFIESKPKMAAGRGEVLNAIDIDLSGYYLKLINPQIHVSTAEAYANVPFSVKEDLNELLAKEVLSWKGNVKNSFEASIFPVHPVIAGIKDELYAEGAVYSSMSGSGSTVYGLFDHKPSDECEFYCKVLEL